MTAITARTARQVLDERLAGMRRARTVTPKRGWIHAVRQALDMSGVELAKRLSVSRSTITDIERSEQNGTVRLDTLVRVADALDCDLVYALVPRQSLDETVRQEALRKVGRDVRAVLRGMDLENQTTSISPHVVESEVNKLIDSGRVWT